MRTTSFTNKLAGKKKLAKNKGEFEPRIDNSEQGSTTNPKQINTPTT